ncbi:MAG: hypothetical protein AAGE84_01795 [Cyanobacteria bacterium P01_G01_bin.39]
MICFQLAIAMSLTKLLIIVLQLMMISRLSELSGTAYQTQNYGLEIGWDYTQADKSELSLTTETFAR